MIKAIRQLFAPKRKEKGSFSSFYNTASTEDRRKLLEEVAREANEDQRALMKQYERALR